MIDENLTTQIRFIPKNKALIFNSELFDKCLVPEADNHRMLTIKLSNGNESHVFLHAGVGVEIIVRDKDEKI